MKTEVDYRMMHYMRLQEVKRAKRVKTAILPKKPWNAFLAVLARLGV
jgi:hypothetical protein